jgi:hypothetical protein
MFVVDSVAKSKHLCLLLLHRVEYFLFDMEICFKVFFFLMKCLFTVLDSVSAISVT